jgi:hypothetical protein
MEVDGDDDGGGGQSFGDDGDLICGSRPCFSDALLF